MAAKKTATTSVTEETNVSVDEITAEEKEALANMEDADAKADDVITADDTADVDDEEDAEDGEGLTPEEEKMLEALLRKTSFRAHKVMKASKQTQKEMYRDERIITESEDSKVETDVTMLKEDILQLTASARAKRMLDGKIIGVRTANANSNVSTCLAEVHYGNGTCTVLIPDYLLFNFRVEKYRTADGQNKVKQQIVNMIGTEIKFIVKQFDQRTKTAYADRLKAMEQDGYNNYVRHINGTGRPRVQVGDKVQAKVTAVGRNYVTVYALGSECKISQNARLGEPEVSWNHLPDCRTEYRKNQIVNVRVLEIERESVEKYSEKYDLIATRLSIKRTKEDPQEKYFDDFVEGGFYQATVSSVSDAGVYCILNGKVDCLCSFPKYGEMPYVGQERVVEVTIKTRKDASGNEVGSDGKPFRRLFGVFRDV